MSSVARYLQCGLPTKARHPWGLMAQVLRFNLTLLLATLLSLTVAQVCATPGRDGSPSISGVVNSYWTAAVGTYGPTSTSIALSSRRGASVNISAGDLVLIIQMQCADINPSDTLAYGDGVAGEPASGYTDPVGSCLVGRYEFVRAGTGSSSTSLNLAGSLQHTYVEAAATNTAGRRTVQIIRVPQYQDLVLTGTVTAEPWNGSSGGIVVLDVAGTLDLNGGTINVDGQGFRGGAGRARWAEDPRERFRWDRDTRHGTKGEGIAGTPRFVSLKRSPDSGATDLIADLGSGWRGYPTGAASTGDFARGAPGNTGGGGTFWSGSSDNGGGGGGGNGGAGWRSGGYSGISTDYANHLEKKWGFGGGRFLAAGITRLVLGGGGGAGDNNNNSPAAQSSGAAGGGIVMIRAGRLTGDGTISARGGRAADNAGNDGTGGGGAGGSVVVIAPSWEPSLTINAQGGRGGDSFRTGDSAHGPGGGGGGGVVITSGPVTVDVSGGANGLTSTTDNPPGGPAHGAQPGIASSFSAVLRRADTPGAGAGYRCHQIDLRLTKSASLSGPQPGDSMIVTNPSQHLASGVVVTDTLPVGLQVTSLPAGCSQAGQVVTCSVGTVRANASTTLTVTASVLNQPLGTALTNGASVDSAQHDPDLANNGSSSTVIVSGLVLTKAVCNVTASDCTNPANFLAGVPVRPGQVLEYRVNYTRVGPPIFDLVLRDDVPTGTLLITGAYGASQDVVLTCPDGSISHLATGAVTSFNIDLAAHCVLSTATRPGGTTAEALLNNQGGVFRFRVSIP